MFIQRSLLVSYLFLLHTLLYLNLNLVCIYVHVEEYPQASASMGINVIKMRYAGVLISGALAGLSGAIMVLTMDIQFTVSSIHGVSFIALACLIFGKWNPFGCLGAGIFFGFSQVLSMFSGQIPVIGSFPSEFFFAIPYVLTVIALVLFARKVLGTKSKW